MRLFEFRVPLLYHRLCKKYQYFWNEKTCRVSVKPWMIYRSMNVVYPNLTFKTSVKMLGDQLEISLSVSSDVSNIDSLMK